MDSPMSDVVHGSWAVTQRAWERLPSLACLDPLLRAVLRKGMILLDAEMNALAHGSCMKAAELPSSEMKNGPVHGLVACMVVERQLGYERCQPTRESGEPVLESSRTAVACVCRARC